MATHKSVHFAPSRLTWVLARSPNYRLLVDKSLSLLHRLQPGHTGIIVCTDDRDWEVLAHRVHASIMAAETLQGKLIRVVRPA